MSKNSESVKKRRAYLQEVVLHVLGSKCCICGYNRCSWALEAHHVNPSTKEFPLGARGYTFSLDRNLREINKCVLLCANCHREHHAGLISTATLSEIWRNQEAMRRRRAETIIKDSEKTEIKCSCGAEKSWGAKTCRRCYEKSRKPKINWPEREWILSRLKTTSYLSLGKELGVSDNAIRKYLKRSMG